MTGGSSASARSGWSLSSARTARLLVLVAAAGTVAMLVHSAAYSPTRATSRVQQAAQGAAAPGGGGRAVAGAAAPAHVTPSTPRTRSSASPIAGVSSRPDRHQGQPQQTQQQPLPHLTGALGAAVRFSAVAGAPYGTAAELPDTRYCRRACYSGEDPAHQFTGLAQDPSFSWSQDQFRGASNSQLQATDVMHVMEAAVSEARRVRFGPGGAAAATGCGPGSPHGHPLHQWAFNRVAVNIGAKDGKQQDPTYPLFAEGYRGLAVEASSDFCPGKLSANLPAGNITKLCEFVDVERVGEQLARAGVPADVDVFKLDIDSVDCVVMQAVMDAGYRPKLVLVEVNEKVPPPVRFAMRLKPTPETPKPTYRWQLDHAYGCSLDAMSDVMGAFGYHLLHMDWDVAFFVPTCVCDAFGDVPHDTCRAYDAGYRKRAGRSRAYPHNWDVSHWLDMAAEELPGAVCEFMAAAKTVQKMGSNLEVCCTAEPGGCAHLGAPAA